jgi:hypothetical protein
MPKDRAIRFEIAVESDDELRALRGALLAARATELGEVERRSQRQSLGYGTDSARDAMSAEVTDRRRRLEMLDRLLAAIGAATATATATDSRGDPHAD